MRVKTLTISGLFVATAALGTVACGDADEPTVIDQSGDNQSGDQPDNQSGDNGTSDISGLAVLGDGDDDIGAVDVESIASSFGEDLLSPTDLEFHPERDDELWVVNYDDNSSVVISQAGSDDQSSQKFDAMGNDHFLVDPAALAFNHGEEMATAQQTDEETQPTTPGDYMGPTLWPTDLDDFDGGQPSHLDMMHNSPLSSGIAWDRDITPSAATQPPESDPEDEQEIGFWLFDGYHGSLTHYDFHEDHDMGGSDHSDGYVHRYAEDQLEVEDGTVSHIAFDADTELLYAADTGNNRIAVLDTTTGEPGDSLASQDGAHVQRIDDAELTTLVDGADTDLEQPAGLELHDDILFVGDAATSMVFAFDLEGNLVDRLDVSPEIQPGGLMGMTFDVDGRLYLTDADASQIIRIEGQ